MKKFVAGIFTFLWLGFWVIFAQNILPDSVEITVKDPIIMWEATNLKVRIMKNGSKMTSYDGTIWMVVTEQDWKKLSDNEYTVPSRWMYSFLSSDLWEKEFQRWLEIKKEWTFYIEIQDLNENEDKILWKQLIHVVRWDPTGEVKNINILNPITSSNLIGDKVEVIWSAKDIPNSEAIIYIDEKAVWTTRVGSDWMINHTIWSVEAWQHSLLVEIPDLAWNVMWRSEKIFFTISPTGNNGIRDIDIDPEKWLMIWDMTNITVYTDDMIESVKIRLSDRTENESMVMNKIGNWEFSQNVFLMWTWEVSLSFDTSASNGSVNQSYDNYKKIIVWEVPSVYDINVDINSISQIADVSWEVNNRSVVSSYLVNWWVDWSDVLSWKDWSDKPSFRFSDVPYDTVIKLNVTPYRNKQDKHWAPSETIKFVITKNQDTCWNLVCDDGESHELCPQDCYWSWEATIFLWPSCPKQTISVSTKKVWDNYYLVWDKVDMVTKYIVYSSSSPDWKNKVKVYETTDTSYEYPFDRESKEDVFMYFWVVWICEDGEELELTGATKVQVWPAENFFLLVCLTFLIYAGIKLFRQTEE